MSRPIVSAVLLPLILAGCVAMPAAQAPAVVPIPVPDAAEPQVAAVAPDDNLNAVLWMRSAEYRAASAQAYRAAITQLDRAMKDRDWDALDPAERANPARGLPPAVVLDVDETVLDNSPYQARLIASGEEYSEPTWDAWVQERKARPVPGVLDFAKAAQARGITLLYLSNRAVHLKEATLANLRAAGLPVKNDSVFMGLGTVVRDCEQDGSEKNCRRQLAGRSYRVLMQFGDQLGDFVQVPANTPEGRTAVYEAHAPWFGERWWMLPNPSYGSWEPALFNNDYRQPRDARRQAKRGALDTAP